MKSPILTAVAWFFLLAAFASFAEDRRDGLSQDPPGLEDVRVPRVGLFATQGRRIGRRVIRFVLTLLAAIAIVVGLFALFEPHLIYRPVRHPRGNWSPSGLNVEDCFFQTDDGLMLHGWWAPAANSIPAARRPVILWCHGNAGNVTHRAENMRLLVERGLDVFIMDYRGFGRSQGRPSEKGIYRDVDAAYRYLIRERSVPADQMVVFGRSLGAAVALHLALCRPVAGLILESAFESGPAMARVICPWLPLSLAMRSRFDNVSRISELEVPLLMTHGEEDGLVPIRQGRMVFAVAPEPKEFFTIANAGHNDTYRVGGEPYLDKLVQFCRSCVMARKPEPSD